MGELSMCARCGKKFDKKRYWQKFCSQDCQRTDWILEKAKQLTKQKKVVI